MPKAPNPNLSKRTPTPTVKKTVPTEAPVEAKGKAIATPVAVVTKTGGVALADFKDKMKALVAQTKKAETPSGGFISLKGGRMSVGEVRLPGDKINAIVVDYRMDNEFYPNAYVAGQAGVTSCAAVVRPLEFQSPWRALRKGETPDQFPHSDADLKLVTEATDPQVPAGMGCNSCRMLEFNTAHLIKGKTGSGKGKACRETRRLHIFAADQCTTPDDISRAPYLTLIPPPTSLTPFQVFANEVTEVLGNPIFGAVVEISVVPDEKYQFTVQYKILEAIRDEGILFALLQRHEEISAKEISLPKATDTKAVQDAREQVLNKERRAELEVLSVTITEIGGKLAALKGVLEEAKSTLEECKSDLDGIKDEEQEYLDDMPEAFQQGDRGQTAESAISEMEEGLSKLDDATTAIEEAAEHIRTAQA